MKHIIAVFLMLASYSAANACDICTAFSRLKPNDFKHTLGMQYSLRSLSGNIPSGLKHLGHLSGLYSADRIEEKYYTLDLRGRFRFSDRLAVIGILPFKLNERTQNFELRESGHGLGDASAFIEYAPFLAKSDRTLKFMTNLRTGVKFPTGNTQQVYQENTLDHDFQLGSGSYDFYAGTETYLGSMEIGLVVSQLYKRNTNNLTDYKFGDSYNALALLTKKWEKSDLIFSIAAGAQIDKQWEDEEENEILLGTSRTALSAAGKINVSYKNFEAFAFIVSPIKQETNDFKTLPIANMTQIGFNYLINKK